MNLFIISGFGEDFSAAEKKYFNFHVLMEKRVEEEKGCSIDGKSREQMTRKVFRK